MRRLVGPFLLALVYHWAWFVPFFNLLFVHPVPPEPEHQKARVHLVSRAKPKPLVRPPAPKPVVKKPLPKKPLIKPVVKRVVRPRPQPQPQPVARPRPIEQPSVPQARPWVPSYRPATSPGGRPGRTVHVPTGPGGPPGQLPGPAPGPAPTFPGPPPAPRPTGPTGNEPAPSDSGGPPPAPQAPPPAPAPPPLPAPAPAAPGVPDREATPVGRPNIKMPDDLRRNGGKTFVRVEIEVAADGRTTIHLLTSSGSTDFDQQIQQRLADWAWEPAVQNGQPVSSKQRYKLEFEVGE